MTSTWISEAMQAGLRFIGWPSKAASRRSSQALSPAAQEKLYELQSFAAQTQQLLTFQNDFLLPLMEELKKGYHSSAAGSERIARFVRRARELGLQSTHPALGNMADVMLGVGEKDFGSYKTYQDLNQLKLSIEEAGHTMYGRMRELREARPRRPSNKR